MNGLAQSGVQRLAGESAYTAEEWAVNTRRLAVMEALTLLRVGDRAKALHVLASSVERQALVLGVGRVSIAALAPVEGL